VRPENVVILKNQLCHCVSCPDTWRVIGGHSTGYERKASIALPRVISGLVGDFDRLSHLRYGSNALGSVLSEQDFHSALANESKRTARSGREFQVLLVSLPSSDSLPLSMEAGAARKVFLGLRFGLQKTDYVGWCWEGRIAGAILPVFGDDSPNGVSGPIENRVDEMLQQSYRGANFPRLVYRVCPHRELMP